MAAGVTGRTAVSVRRAIGESAARKLYAPNRVNMEVAAYRPIAVNVSTVISLHFARHFGFLKSKPAEDIQPLSSNQAKRTFSVKLLLKVLTVFTPVMAARRTSHQDDYLWPIDIG
ncbi:hypothetical protein C0Q70_16186 [Pomacea canaliculata]|uniref:Uncharacterized protein n=1 Tax=Pomacea canaliculata TaxID=400727 RepID=A0A2T7NP47_POMCA|nr:hypothetical protein C0Q70_16186 [Pomacea canaliculata]